MKVGRWLIPHNSILHSVLTDKTHAEAMQLLKALEELDRERLQWISNFRSRANSTTFSPKLSTDAKTLIAKVEALVPGYTSVKRYGYGLLTAYESQTSKKALMTSMALLQATVRESTGLELDRFMERFFKKLNGVFSLAYAGHSEDKRKAFDMITKLQFLIRKYGIDKMMADPIRLELLTTKPELEMSAKEFKRFVQAWSTSVLQQLSQQQLVFLVVMMELTDDTKGVEAVVIRRIDYNPQPEEYLLTLSRKQILDLVEVGHPDAQWWGFDTDSRTLTYTS